MKKKILVLMSLFVMATTAVACSKQGDYYEGFISEDEGKGAPVPAGAEYARKNKIYTPGQNMPGSAIAGDVYKHGDYVYTMKSDGWSVALQDNVDKTKASFGEIEEEIANSPVVDLSDLFKGCTNMTVSPAIPASVKVMNNTFYDCESLLEAPEFPKKTESVQYTFYNCKSMTKGTAIPEGVKDIKYIYYGCASLTELPAIPESVTAMTYAFTGCASATTAPKLPSKAKLIGFCFSDCTSLIEGPEIPETVTDMSGVFKNCTSLKTAPRIPANVDYLTDTFNSCTSLTGTLVIDCNASNRAGCFRLVNFKEQGLTITGSSTVIDKLMATGITN